MRVCRCSATTVCSRMFVSKLGRHKRTSSVLSPQVINLNVDGFVNLAECLSSIAAVASGQTEDACALMYTGDSRSWFGVGMPTTFLFTSVTSRNGLSPQTLAYPTQCEFRQFAVLVSLLCVLTVPVPWCSYLVVIVNCVYILWVIAIWN